MTLSEVETYSARRFHFTVVSLLVLIVILVLIGFLSHRTISYNEPVWKSAPYGDVHDTGTVRAGR